MAAIFEPSRRHVVAAGIAVAALARPALALTTGKETRGPAPLSIGALPPWTVLPPTPSLPSSTDSRTIPIDGVPIFYARFGQGPAVVFLHGGMGNSDYWGHQVRHLSERFTVIAMDTRGHGRSPLTDANLAYSLFAQDVIGVMDALGIGKASIVGWSDGAITGLELAMRYPDRVERLFAFAGNLSRSAMKRCAGGCPTFVAYVKRCKEEYATLSPEPGKWPDLMTRLRAMWRGQAEYEAAALARIKSPTVIADGQYDEIIKPNHAAEAARLIPGARVVALPNASHFGMLQQPAMFNTALDRFLSKAG